MKKPAIFYGYWIVLACAGIQAIGVGTYVTFGVFFKSFLAEFDLSRATLSGAHSLTFLIAGMVGILVGRLTDRFGPRILMSVAGSFCGVSLLLMSRISALWQLYLFYSVFFGIGLSAVDVIALSTTARWFVRRRGLMTGIVKMGTGLGQLVMPLAAGLLITGFGWRTSYMILGGMALALLIAVAQLLRRDPAHMGLLPDAAFTEISGSHFVERGISFGEALRNPQFWTILFANLAACFSLMSVMLHIVPHATDIGIHTTAAAGILSTIGGVSILGRFVIGNAIDRIGNRNCMILCFILLIMILLWLQAATELWMLYLFAAVYGFTHGGFFTVISPIVAEYFGLYSHGLLFGMAVFAGTVGGFIGPIFAGKIFDMTGGYGTAFWVCICTAAVGLGLIFSLGPVRVKIKKGN
ncbi:MAG: MFS transporter [Deltaproteobacteria bacterium]|nr:MFS transporter [Deltaproteobacteria bacterium]